jgi:hypothetical protein
MDRSDQDCMEQTLWPVRIFLLCYLPNLVRFLGLNLEGNSPPGQHQMTERLGCPGVSRRSGNGLVFWAILRPSPAPRLLLGTRSLSVRLAPATRERIPLRRSEDHPGRVRGGRVGQGPTRAPEGP